jgi:integrase
MAVEITPALIDKLRPPPVGRIEIPDSRVIGLALRITSTDVRSWTVRGRLPDGRQVRRTIGKFPKVGIQSARSRARQALGDIEAGIDRTAEKRAAQQAQRRAVTVTERLSEWQAAKASTWSQRYAAEVKRLCDQAIIPKLGAKALAEPTRAQWTELASRLHQRTPGTASWVYSTISSFLNHSEAVGWIETNPLPRRGRNHIAPQVKARSRALDDVELLRLWRASAQLSPKTRVFTRLLIMCACRVSEAANIAVGEIDILRKRWRVPATRTKNRLAHILPLHPLLIAELTKVWPQGRVDKGYRLLGQIRGNGFTAPSKVKLQIDRLAGISEPWVWHDLRRSFRSAAPKLGIPERHAELALNHVSNLSQLEQVYNVYTYEAEILVALGVWQEHVFNILRLDQQNLLDTTSA